MIPLLIKSTATTNHNCVNILSADVTIGQNEVFIFDISQTEVFSVSYARTRILKILDIYAKARYILQDSNNSKHGDYKILLLRKCNFQFRAFGKHPP